MPASAVNGLSEAPRGGSQVDHCWPLESRPDQAPVRAGRLGHSGHEAPIWSQLSALVGRAGLDTSQEKGIESCGYEAFGAARKSAVRPSISCPEDPSSAMALPLADAVAPETDMAAQQKGLMEVSAEVVLTKHGLDLQFAGRLVSLYEHWSRCDPCSGRKGFRHGTCVYQQLILAGAPSGPDKLDISVRSVKSIFAAVGCGKQGCKGPSETRAFVEETRRIFTAS